MSAESILPFPEYSISACLPWILADPCQQLIDSFQKLLCQLTGNNLLTIEDVQYVGTENKPNYL